MDLIDRQKAINKFEPWLKVEGYSEGERNMLKAVLYELRVMPSAHPYTAEEIDKAQELESSQLEKAYELGRASVQPERMAPTSYEEQLSLDCSFCREHECGNTLYELSSWDGGMGFDYIRDIRFCPICGRKLYGDE